MLPAETEAEYLQQYPLLTYALSNWGRELERVLEPDTPLWRSTEAFLGISFHEWNDIVKRQIIELFADAQRILPRAPHITIQEIMNMDGGSIEGLYWVVIFDLPGLVPFWIDVDTECLVKDPIPMTPLGLAAFLYNTSMMNLLIKHGAQVNLTQRTDIHVKPPLFDAVFSGSVSAIKLLLKSGADMTSRRGFDDVSPLDIAYRSLLNHKSDVLISYFSGLNGTSAQVLQFLVRSGRVEDLRDAIRGGIDINHPCENGKRALDYAFEMENEEIAELLRNNKAISNLHWPAEKTEVCPYPMNLREPIATPLISKEKDYDQEEMMSDGGIQEDLILEIPIHTKHPIRSIVFETITATRDECTEDRFRRPYMGLNRSGLSVALENQDGTRQIFTFQNNLHEIFVQGDLQDSEDFRLHTNIWNLSELDA
ncbi:unnamed protein product [Fusarium graminearum]|uniref:Uncharacterized protein n=1 Tax=Gibberella zeae TaxID=5518 RepID=A0A4E9DVD7_GIBZA|nr:unnamed protein product [Fusarium graminearum]CAG1965081.1 unnamed protein product [Fusarium graminearum]